MLKKLRWLPAGLGLVASGVVALVAAGCSGTAIVDGSGGTGGTSANATGADTVATNATDADNGTSSGLEFCNEATPCASTHYCATSPDACTDDGVCLERPSACPEDCPGVCGCDGQVYCNACIAQSVGVDIASDGICAEPNVSYVAFAYPGGLDHILIGKADFNNNTCVMLNIDAPSMGDPSYQISAPAPWAVGNAFATPSAEDCLAGMPNPEFFASGGAGTIDWEPVPMPMYYPCELNIDAVINFDSPPAWLEPSVVMNGSAKVEGCF